MDVQDEIIPKNNPEKSTCEIVAATKETYFVGPLPSPEVFGQYDQILPGAAERILVMAEKQAEHRQFIEKKIINTGSRDSMFGIIFAFLLGAITVGAGTIVALNGHPVEGTIFGGISLTSLVGVFIYGTSQNRRKQNEENEEE